MHACVLLKLYPHKSFSYLFIVCQTGFAMAKCHFISPVNHSRVISLTCNSIMANRLHPLPMLDHTISITLKSLQGYFILLNQVAITVFFRRTIMTLTFGARSHRYPLPICMVWKNSRLPRQIHCRHLRITSLLLLLALLTYRVPCRLLYATFIAAIRT